MDFQSWAEKLSTELSKIFIMIRKDYDQKYFGYLAFIENISEKIRSATDIF
jgi:hypothetical protein